MGNKRTPKSAIDLIENKGKRDRTRRALERLRLQMKLLKIDTTDCNEDEFFACVSYIRIYGEEVAMVDFSTVVLAYQTTIREHGLKRFGTICLHAIKREAERRRQTDAIWKQHMTAKLAEDMPQLIVSDVGITTSS